MKEIIHQFAGVLVTILVSAALVVTLHRINDTMGERGGGSVFKAQLLSQEKKTEGLDAAASKRYAERKKPTIYYDTTKKLYAGKTYTLGDYFFAEDAEGKSVPVKILRIKEESGKLYFDGTSGEKEVFFQNAGVYIVTVKAKDTEQVSRIHDIAIAVDVST